MRQRAGTENVSGIAGLGAACLELADCARHEQANQRHLKARLEDGLCAALPSAVIVGKELKRLQNTTLLLVPGLNAETAVIALDLAGFAVATGSACSSGKVTPSHVLRAMGFSNVHARSALRISLGWTSTTADIDHFVAVLAAHVHHVTKQHYAA